MKNMIEFCDNGKVICDDEITLETMAYLISEPKFHPVKLSTLETVPNGIQEITADSFSYKVYFKDGGNKFVMDVARAESEIFIKNLHEKGCEITNVIKHCLYLDMFEKIEYHMNYEDRVTTETLNQIRAVGESITHCDNSLYGYVELIYNTAAISSQPQAENYLETLNKLFAEINNH